MASTSKKPKTDAQETKSSASNKTVSKIKSPELDAKLADVREAFDLFDPNGTGKMATKDLKVALRALGYEPTRKEIQTLVESVAPECPNELSYEEFHRVIKIKVSEEDCITDIIRAFRLFDDDKTGKISLKNLKRVAIELGEDLTDEELLDMIDQADKDGDGQISLDEFVTIFKEMSCL
ncbi:PREDICTED: caltractin-like [Vollenhovia emeryi]|uniref:caltractin-like n=1 Tax=Vollenhovia emeryi TaxID=411798 RepID=UPI0005F4D5C7|nr:PREDICTED: caltractin-like [Vollenhovia emeryi]XP_011867225.1 PREDICTED: caltractin-like [Vollenhovia emeryi]XP_011867226.1 PREDICTED: caltractin-like [Vollenhovia emeryi]